jgi:hypothetical protein
VDLVGQNYLVILEGVYVTLQAFEFLSHVGVEIWSRIGRDIRHHARRAQQNIFDFRGEIATDSELPHDHTKPFAILAWSMELRVVFVGLKNLLRHEVEITSKPFQSVCSMIDNNF